MADLINRTKILDAFKQICERCGKYKQNNGAMCGACYLDDAISIVNDIPAVVDTDLSGSSFRLYRAAYDRGKQEARAEIVRCEECKHYIAHDKRCGYWNHGVSLDWWDEWCSHGERRGDGESD